MTSRKVDVNAFVAKHVHDAFAKSIFGVSQERQRYDFQYPFNVCRYPTVDSERALATIVSDNPKLMLMPKNSFPGPVKHLPGKGSPPLHVVSFCWTHELARPGKLDVTFNREAPMNST